jgi:hypothetical protein
LRQEEITATRCSSFWLKRTVSLFIGRHFHWAIKG